MIWICLVLSCSMIEVFDDKASGKVLKIISWRSAPSAPADREAWATIPTNIAIPLRSRAAPLRQ